MSLPGAVAVVTGADRGLGPVFVDELLRRGARRVHAMSRVPRASAPAGVRPSGLDVTDPDAIALAAARAGDATFVVNHEMPATGARLLDGDLRRIDLEMETGFYGALGVIRAFVPVLVANGGGTIVNVLGPRATGAGAAVAAAASAMTEVVRGELAGQPVRVVGLHVGHVDLGAGDDHLAALVARAFDDLAAGADDLVAHRGHLAA